MGIVFLYIQVPEIKLQDLKELIMSQKTASGSNTFTFHAGDREYDMVKDIKNGDLIFEMIRYNQEDRIDSYKLY